MGALRAHLSLFEGPGRLGLDGRTPVGARDHVHVDTEILAECIGHAADAGAEGYEDVRRILDAGMRETRLLLSGSCALHH